MTTQCPKVYYITNYLTKSLLFNILVKIGWINAMVTYNSWLAVALNNKAYFLSWCMSIIGWLGVQLHKDCTPAPRFMQQPPSVFLFVVREAKESWGCWTGRNILLQLIGQGVSHDFSPLERGAVHSKSLQSCPALWPYES